MENKSYKQKLESMFETLENNPNIEIIEFEREKPLNNEVKVSVIQRLKDDFHLEIPKSILDFYEEQNGFKLVWKPKDDLEVDKETWDFSNCSTKVFPFNELFMNVNDLIYWQNSFGNNLKAAFRSFIDFEDEGQGMYFFLIENKLELYYVQSQGKSISPLKITFEEYFEFFIKSYGFWSWNDLLILENDEIWDSEDTI